jgi:hemolysin III
MRDRLPNTDDLRSAAARVKPRLRGVVHQYAFFVAVVAGAALIVLAPDGKATLAASIYVAGLAGLLGVSALYHRVNWSEGARRWMRRLDHAMIFALIAGTYTPFGLIVLRGSWRISILAVVWSGAAVAIVVKFVWVNAPKWVAASIAIALGWVGGIVFPQILERVGAAGTTLLLVGGIAYTLGAVVYALKRPDPVPAVFGYHEIFHALVVAAVACQYVAVAFFVLPRA